jgi:2-iminobutanoate/2-iminopropanoate deaminase
MKKQISISGAPAPIAPYSQAILAGNTLYISGQIPVNPYTGELVMDTVENAVHQIMGNIKNLLKEAEMDLSNVVKCTIFMKDMNDYGKINEVYGSYFQVVPPAREAVQVARLPKDVSVEISCIAVK